MIYPPFARTRRRGTRPNFYKRPWVAFAKDSAVSSITLWALIPNRFIFHRSFSFRDSRSFPREIGVGNRVHSYSTIVPLAWVTLPVPARSCCTGYILQYSRGEANLPHQHQIADSHLRLHTFQVPPDPCRVRDRQTRRRSSVVFSLRKNIIALSNISGKQPMLLAARPLSTPALYTQQCDSHIDEHI